MDEKQPIDNSAAPHHNQHGDGEDQQHVGNNLESKPREDHDNEGDSGDKGEGDENPAK